MTFQLKTNLFDAIDFAEALDESETKSREVCIRAQEDNQIGLFDGLFEMEVFY